MNDNEFAERQLDNIFAKQRENIIASVVNQAIEGVEEAHKIREKFQQYIMQLVKDDLSKHEDNIFEAIKTNDFAMFMDLGGNDHVDLNFCTKMKLTMKHQLELRRQNKDPDSQSRIFPIMTCVAKGRV